MSTTIYYFSGTGNSLAAVRALSAALGADIVAIAGLGHQEHVTPAADTVGLVFPVYDFNAPKIVADFIGKLNDIGSKYIFAVGTVGIAPLSAMKKVDALVRDRGGRLSGGFAVRMPHNGIGSSVYSKRDDDIRLQKSEEKLKAIATYVGAKEEGRLETSGVISSFILSGLFVRVIPTMAKLLWQLVRGGWKSFAFQTNDACAGCGCCARVCPVDNIKITDRKPVWGESCTGCLACLHWCPNHAVQITKSHMNIRQYHHPAVGADDMFRQHGRNAGASGG